MLSKKNHIIIGLTSFNHEFLRVSIPSIARQKSNIYLIIHNDNPNVKITRAQIRRLGWRGSLRIINTKQNKGQFESWLNILSEINQLGIKSEWMMFMDDDDVLIDLDMPAIHKNNFAVMQNMVVIKKRVIDLLRVMDNPKNYTPDNFHTVVERPHIGITGTLVRTDIMIGLGTMIEKIIDRIRETDSITGIRQRHDIVMWNYLQMYAKHLDPLAAPIYMDRANYIATRIDTAPEKYGKTIVNDNRPDETMMAQYSALMIELLK